MSTPAPTTFLVAGPLAVASVAQAVHVVRARPVAKVLQRVQSSQVRPVGLSSGFPYTGTAHPPQYGQLWSRGGARRGT